MDTADLDTTYQAMRGAYTRILEAMGLGYRVVAADSGAIGGAKSEEFHVLAGSGEDELAVASQGGYAANIEAAVTQAGAGPRPAPGAPLKKIETPGVSTIAGLAAHLDVPETETAKAIVVMGTEGAPVLLMLRGDHTLNTIKAEQIEGIAAPLQMADEATIRAHFGAGPGSLGPVNATVEVIADHALTHTADMVVGANYDGAHFTGFNWGRDHPEPRFADLRNVVAGDASPDGQGTIEILRGIEVGHVFQLGDKYSRALNLTVLDEAGKEVVPEMGCYGFGVSRVVAAAIEQCHDEAGIVWPPAIAPFSLVIAPIKADKSAAVREACEALYTGLKAAGVDVAYDDRGLRPGPMFADAELIGIPHRIVVSERGLASGMLEYKGRQDSANDEVAHDIAAICAKIGHSLA